MEVIRRTLMRASAGSFGMLDPRMNTRRMRAETRQTSSDNQRRFLSHLSTSASLQERDGAASVLLPGTRTPRRRQHWLVQVSANGHSSTLAFRHWVFIIPPSCQSKFVAPAVQLTLRHPTPHIFTCASSKRVMMCARALDHAS